MKVLLQSTNGHVYDHEIYDVNTSPDYLALMINLMDLVESGSFVSVSLVDDEK